jgi:branched-chain amino acid transport system ATP-binding protein
MALLQISAVDAYYGQFQALFATSLTIDEGQTVAVIGANGAGKSTLLKAVSGLVAVGAGDIVFDGRSLLKVPAHRRVGLGVALVPEGRRIFPGLSVAENLEVGKFTGRPGEWDVVRVLATFPLLERLLDRSAAQLSGGEQQALAIGRALMSNPRLLLLDEVSLGLAPVVIRQLYDALPTIQAAGTTVLLVEQDTTQALAASDQVYCLLEGRVSLEGRPTDLSRADITAAYFGMVRS